MNQGMWEASRMWKRLGNGLSHRASRREHNKPTRGKTEAKSQIQRWLLSKQKRLESRVAVGMD